MKSTSNRIIDELMEEKRAGDMSRYKQYLTDPEFKEQFRHIILRMVSTIEAAPAETFINNVGFTHFYHQTI